MESDIFNSVVYVHNLNWLGFCQSAFPAVKTELTVIDFLGFTWKLFMEFCHNEQLSCDFSGEWQTLCNARKLIEGANIKLGVTGAANNGDIGLSIIVRLQCWC
ncbi:hypothetical protein MtrunA17_Chr8g0365871 [Medicago truncatula]|uniref:Uncharacterized protein n=1 Tax=Medicago truncatula TaxID=3880 RepID=A0A396GLZ1_MEDTR|nr:hypothetical protein MtrunA17_Chr8g0365871 [Medicago truncatula]